MLSDWSAEDMSHLNVGHTLRVASRAVEGYLCTDMAISGSSQAKYKGRGQPPRAALKPLLHSKPWSARSVDPACSYWALAASALVERAIRAVEQRVQAPKLVLESCFGERWG